MIDSCAGIKNHRSTYQPETRACNRHPSRHQIGVAGNRHVAIITTRADRSQSPPWSRRSHPAEKVDPLLKITLLFTVKMPGLLSPGFTVPPLLTVTGPLIAPLPPKVAPLFTATAPAVMI